MGSTGSGTFSDYSRRKSANQNETNGGASGADNCGQAFSTLLEEVSRCFFFINYSTIPPSGTEVTIAFNGVRLVAENSLGEELGYLPTKYNYLKYCLNDKFRYSGFIDHSTLFPTPSIRVDIAPI
ncbi:hypothetical protein [Flavobacterium lindanitolerans]|uniref:hypothetical protein n=1 Tax=Flavobacterium lindanitolerans TaxID=428988 RepID=UPI001A6429EA|nr:hypothetical protein [Flavobacterium lindanitolerans]MBL7866767.1 hypothetical protein [Flavobacterium lindanitolerans]MDQ7959564.1 hypothetical protein [Flavobacterium lindanitolerans]